MRHGQVTLTNVTLSDCLRFAYEITNDLQIAGPDWIRNTDVRFDIVAKAAPESPDSRLRLMLQNLLADRFKLVLHREQRPLSFLALAVGKNSVELQESQAGPDGSANRLCRA